MRESGTETILPRLSRGKGEKNIEVLILEQSYHIPIVVKRCGAKPCLVQEQPKEKDLGKSSLANDFDSNVKTR